MAEEESWRKTNVDTRMIVGENGGETNAEDSTSSGHCETGLHARITPTQGHFEDLKRIVFKKAQEGRRRNQTDNKRKRIWR